MHSSNSLKSFSLRLCAGFLAISSFSSLHAQQDFNHFQTLKARGPIPADFTTPTEAKILSDIATKPSEFSPTQKRIFYESIHHNIDPILHSGYVVYGDEISVYVEKVADKLLENDPELRKQLRFYTVKSNATNALSTEQGIIFVTTGLISQLTSEAQLAYVLSHEIAHYTEKHIIETFDWKTDNSRTSNRIEKLSAHSREHELDADRLALKLYHDAGYSEDEILSTFDVLMYSYLPFDEVPMPNSYFISDRMYIPGTYFATKKYPITAEEDYQDYRSSHPNIKKRKDAVTNALADYDDWGKEVFPQGESTFNYIRDLARFESVRTSIIDARYGDALYEVFLLERQFPESVYLQQTKAIAWLGLMEFKEDNKLSEILPNSSDYEGESAAMYYFLKKLNDAAMTTMTIRTIYDIRRRFPEDSMMIGIEQKLLKKLAETETFKWSDYSTKDFRESARLASAKPDTTVVEEEKPEIEKSKYEKIKTKRSIEAPESFDSTKFYFYGLSDVVADSVLMAEYKHFKKEYNEEKKAREDAEEEAMHHRTKTTDYDYVSAIGLKKVVLVQPSVSYYVKEKPAPKLVDKYETLMTKAIVSTTSQQGVELKEISQQRFEADGTEAFNDRNTLYAMLEQTAATSGNELMPVDYEALKALEQKYGTPNVMYTAISYYHHAETSTLVMDMSTGNVKSVNVIYGRSVPSEKKFGVIYTNIFERMKAEPQ